MTDPRQDLLTQLAPVLDLVAELPLAECRDADEAARLAARLESTMPAQGELAQAIGRSLREGIAAGWLCDRGEPSARFSRVAKADPRTRDLSIDVVDLEGPALRHRHPRGEVTLGFAIDPTAEGSRFDGHPPGWVVMPAGSVHTPTVTGPRMALLYFLPDGAVEWNPAD
ncbi:4-hydroxylaminobenzoate lyase [Paraliomyxa miuraensis]|uniref:4-hydroxylaminobenzoate lyase n=1 Tax=Paraliomyxa miuraensis TaxID=376150 RepID=UPI00224E430F|nr:DUF4863 family protein [Paraliomyxa miuraensis]MCX4239937.1 DUF4863 family protein [Paraliomyxa miuraensis]